jgi:hypothetical protein
MAKYDVDFSCGHTAEVQIFGKSKDRQSRIKWLERCGICPDCYRAQKEKEKKEAEEKASAEAKDIGLADLQGSEKQIAWANKIRLSAIENLNNEIKSSDGRVKDCLKALIQAIGEETSASRIINERDKILRSNAADYFNIEIADIDSGKSTPDDFEWFDGGFFVQALKDVLGCKEEPVETVVLSPEHKESELLVKVNCADNEVSVESPKDRGVIEIAKGCGFRWNGAVWMMQIGFQTGSAEDRAAEIANKLLLSGYQVSVPTSISQAAVSGNYEPRCTRWISKYTDDDKHVYVSWDRSDDMYYHAKEITGSKWVSCRGMRIPTSSADEIEDFAQLYGFQITSGAKELIAEYRKSVTIVAPESGKTAEKKDGKEALDNILQSSRDVIEDLKDD